MRCVSGEAINWTAVSISRKAAHLLPYTRAAHGNALRFGWLCGECDSRIPPSCFFEWTLFRRVGSKALHFNFPWLRHPARQTPTVTITGRNSGVSDIVRRIQLEIVSYSPITQALLRARMDRNACTCWHWILARTAFPEGIALETALIESAASVNAKSTPKNQTALFSAPSSVLSLNGLILALRSFDHWIFQEKIHVLIDLRLRARGFRTAF